MTFTDLQEHFHNLELLEEAELTVNNLRAIHAVNYDQIKIHGTETRRQTEAKALLIEKQMQIVKDLQDRVDKFNQEQLQPFLDSIDIINDLKIWNCLYMRYIAGFRWDEIAETFSENTDAVKARCYRYLRSHLPQ